MTTIYVEIKNWEDVNWYLQNGFYVANPNGIKFPGYFTLRFDLESEEQRKVLRSLIISARDRGIKITTDDNTVLQKIGLFTEGMKDNMDNSNQENPVVGTAVSSEKKVSKAGESLEERREQLKKCNEFFLKVADELKDTHVILGSATGVWGSACLVLKGTENQVSYYGKPINSLRVACNWNWHASLKRCDKPDYIQCLTKDLPWAKKRPSDNPELASPPIWGNMVGLFGPDKRYHCVYGERFNRKTKTWEWVEGDVQELVKKLRESIEPKATEDISDEVMKEEVHLDEL